MQVVRRLGNLQMVDMDGSIRAMMEIGILQKVCQADLLCITHHYNL